MLINMNRKGSILPFTLIILSFVSIILFAFATQVNRVGERLNSYDRVSEIQISTRNIIHIAGACIVDSINQYGRAIYSEWDGFDALIKYAASRGGKEGAYWETVFEWFKKEPEGGGEVTAHFWDLSKDSTFTAILSSSEGVFNTSDRGAVVYKHDSDTYSIISWTGTENTARRYSYGLFLRTYGFSNPALVLGDLSKTLYQYRSSDLETIYGTKIIGDAVILGDVTINGDDDPRYIFEGTLSASNVITTYEEYDYTRIATPADVYFSDLKSEHLASLPSTGYTINMSESDLPETHDDSVLPLTEDTLVTITTNPASESVQELRLEFLGDGSLKISTLEPKTQENTYKVKKSTTITPRDHKIFIVFERAILVGDGVATKMDLINGNYSITVYGDVNITKSLVYEPLQGLFNDGSSASNAPVSNQPLGQTTADLGLLTNQLLKPETQASLEGIHLELVSVGGNVNFLTESTSSHSIAVMHGDYKAFSVVKEASNPNGEPEIVGGDFVLELGKEKKSGSEFWTFGSLMGSSFTGSDFTNDLRRLLAISNSSGEGDVVAVPKGFSVVGIRSW